MRKKLLLYILFFTVGDIGNRANSQNLEWAGRMGGTDYDKGVSVAADANGNVYVTGYFALTADFDPGTGSYPMTSAGSYDVFVSKLDAAGNLVWAKQIGGTSTDYGYSIAVDAGGNVYITGQFSGTSDFDPGAGIYNMASAGSYDIFVAKLDASGNFIWAKQIGGTDSDGANSIIADASSNVYITGSFRNSADFDPGTGTFNMTSAGVSDAFIEKLDASGNFIWAGQAGAADADNGISVTLDASGNVYYTGHFQNTVDFDPGAGTYNLTSGGGTDIFISKLSAAGNFIWAKQFSAPGYETVSDIAVDINQNVYTTGYFNGTFNNIVDFDPGPGTYNLSPYAYEDAFVSKLDASGNFVWAKQLGQQGHDFGIAIAVDGSGNVFTAGQFDAMADFDPGTGTYYLTPSNSSVDVYISKLNSSGNFLWAKQLGGSDTDYPNSIALDGSGNLLVTGSFYGTADFDPGFGTLNLTSAGYSDIFVVKLNNCAPPANITAAGATAFCSPGSVTLNANTGAGLTYQWRVNGGNISGATAVSYVATATGNYECIVSNTCGGTLSNSISVTVYLAPAASITSNATAICSSNPVYLTANTGAGLTYQWQLNSGNIAGATNYDYYAYGTGTYRCIVTNPCGSATSNSIGITTGTTPTISISAGGPTTFCHHPTSYPYGMGSVTLTASATGSGLSYQWRNGNSIIAGETSTTYFASASGSYNCLVTNACGTFVSNYININVLPGPTNNIYPLSGTTCYPNTVGFSVTCCQISYQWWGPNPPFGFGPISGQTTNWLYANQPGYYFCVIYDGQCYSRTDSVHLTVYYPPSISIAATGPTAFCNTITSVTLNATSTGATYQWKQNSTNIPGATSSSYTATAAGTYTCVAWDAASGVCSATSNAISVTVVTSAPTPTITAGGPTTFCTPGSVGLSVNSCATCTYQWRQDGVNITGATSTSRTVSVSGSYDCVVTNACGSATSNAIVVTANSPPVASITAAGPTSFCSPGSVTLNASTAPGNTYQWRLNSVNITGATSDSYSATSAGAYTCRVTNNGCSATSNSITVTISSTPPTASITAAGPTTFCSPGSVTLNANTGTGLSYQWRLNSSAIVGATSSSYAATAAGNYDCIVSNNCGSTTSNTITVTVNSAPPAVINAAGPITFCGSGSVTLNANTGSGLSYQWRLNGVDIAGEVAASYMATAAGFYDCVVSNSCGSTASNIITVVIDVLPLANVTAAGPVTFCSPGSVTLNVSICSACTYQWRLNSGNISGANASSYNATATGDYDCLVTNTCGTRTSNTITVTTEVSPTAAITAAGSTIFCSPGSVTLNANTGPGLLYQWRLNTVNISGATASSYAATSTGIYDCVVSNTCGSAASNFLSITAENLASSTISSSGPTTFCNPGSVTLYADYNILYAYQWWLNGSPAPGPFSTSSAYIATVGGTYQCFILNTCGVTPSDPVTVTVVSAPTASITAAGATTFCAPGSVTLNANTGVGLSYQWRLNAGNISGATSASYNATATGNYDCIVSNVCGSITSNAISVTVNPLPTASITAGGSTSVCAPNTVILNANTGAGLSYQWKLNGNNISGATASSYNATATGNYSCLVFNTCGSATSNIIAVSVSIIPATPGSITGQTTGVCSSVKTYSISAVSGATGYTWAAPAGASISSGQGTTSVNVTYTSSFGSGSISVAATNTCGSSGTSTLVVSGIPPQPGIITGPASVCHNQNNVDYTIVAVTGAASYTWTVPAGTQIKNGQGTTHIRVRFGNAAGNITVTAINTCGASPVRTLAVVMPCRDNEISGDDLDVILYPNPATDKLNVICYTLYGNETLELLTVVGENIFKSEIRNPKSEIDISLLPDGIYFVKIVSGEQKKVLKFIKQD